MRYGFVVAMLAASALPSLGQGGREMPVEVGHRTDVKLGDTFGFYGRASDLPGKFGSDGGEDSADVVIDSLLVEDESDYARVARLTGAFEVKRGPAKIGGRLDLVRAVARKDLSVNFVVSILKRFAPETAKVTLDPDFARRIGEVQGGQGYARFIEDYGFGAVTSVTPAAGIHLVYRLRFHTQQSYDASAAEVRAKVNGFGRGMAAWSDTVKKHGRNFRVELNIVQTGADPDNSILDTLTKLRTDDPDALAEAAKNAVRTVKRKNAAVVAYTIRPWTLIAPAAFDRNDGLRAAVNKSPELFPKYEQIRLQAALLRAAVEEQLEVAKVLGRPTGPAEQLLARLDEIERSLNPFDQSPRLPTLPRLGVAAESVIGKVEWVLTEQRGGDPDKYGCRHYRVNAMPQFTLPHAEAVEWVAVRYEGLPLYDNSDDSLFVKFGGIFHPHPQKELPPRKATRLVTLDRAWDGSPIAGKAGPVDVRLDLPFNWLVQINPEAYDAAGKYGNPKTATVHTWEAVRAGMQKVRGSLLLKARGSDELVEVALPPFPADIKVVARY